MHLQVNAAQKNSMEKSNGATFAYVKTYRLKTFTWWGYEPKETRKHIESTLDSVQLMQILLSYACIQSDVSRF